MRNIFPLLSGNKKLKALLGAHIAEGKLSHAYIFEGDDGSGKMTCALSAAASLACEKRNDALSPLPAARYSVFSRRMSILYLRRRKNRSASMRSAISRRLSTFRRTKTTTAYT